MGINRKLLKLIFFALPAIIIFALIAAALVNNLQVDESGALFGGQKEKGYPSAGYLITKTDAEVKSCGYAVLNNNIAITASHCVDDALSIFLGKGDFSYSEQNKKPIESAVQKSGWVAYKTRTEDFAVLRFSDTGFFRDFAEIGGVEENCNYRVVAYGRTENADEYGKFPRKSAKMCTYEIQNEVFRIKADASEKAGICFGDSGSPLFIEGTNKVVGIVASIIHRVPNDPNPCDFGNSAIVVRADANLRIVNENIDLASTNFASPIPLNQEVLIEVAEETLIEQIGLYKLENLTEDEKLIVILTGAISLIVILMLIFARINFIRRKKEEEAAKKNKEQLSYPSPIQSVTVS